MNTAKIFRNSWDLMLRYRALWIFGVILALTTVSFGSALWLRDDETPANQRTLVEWDISGSEKAWILETFGFDVPQHYTLTAEDLRMQLDDPSLTNVMRERLFKVALSILAGSLVLGTAALVLRYTAEAALIRMVNDRQYRDKVYAARQGWSLGFSTTALKLFLIDILGIVLLLTATMVLPLPALLPAFIAITGSPAAISISVLLIMALTLASLAVLIPLWIAGHASIQLAKRACSLEGLGVFASLWRGIQLVRAQLSGVGLTWLVIAGLELVYPILAAPAAILLAAVGLLVGGGFALLLGTLLALVLAKATAWTIAFITGLVLLALAVVVPMAWLDGMRETLTSAAWTLTFREAQHARASDQAPAPDTPLPLASPA